VTRKQTQKNEKQKAENNKTKENRKFIRKAQITIE
jgi:hypothetical protein